MGIAPRRRPDPGSPTAGAPWEGTSRFFVDSFLSTELPGLGLSLHGVYGIDACALKGSSSGEQSFAFVIFESWFSSCQ